MIGTMARKKFDTDVNFECYVTQKAAYSEAAIREGLSISAWIRRTLDSAIRSGVKMGKHRSELSEESE